MHDSVDRLSWLFYPHRHAITEARIALTLAAEMQAYPLIWYADEEIAALKEQTHVRGKPAPIRPDGFLVIDPGRRAPCFLEVQLQSEPRAYLSKAHAFESYYVSGGYTARFGFESLRVLAVTDTGSRAQHLHQVVSGSSIVVKDMFWATSLPQLSQNPFGPIWLVGGEREQQSLLGSR